MNEELKIIISAVTSEAQKGIKEVKTQIGGLGKSAKGVGGVITGVFKGVGKVATVAVAGVLAVAGAITALGKSTLDFQKEQAKLNTAFLAAGSTAEQASRSYSDLYRYLGDSGKATEAAAHLAKITTNQKNLAEWTKITQGIYATFGDSLPIEGLTEAANETIRVGKVTGSMADALNWAGVSEDAFNDALANTNSLEEREALTRDTLNKLYKDAAEIYEQNNKALLDYNESQARIQVTTGELGKATLPLMTAFNNLGNTLLTSLKPAFDVIIPVLANFINMITSAISTVASFFSTLTGKSQSVKTVAQGVNVAATGSKNLATGLGDSKKQAEALKKSTQGFDELNIVSSGTSASTPGTSGGSGGSSPLGAGTGGEVLGFTTEIVEGESKALGFVAKVKEVFGELAAWFTSTFAPSISAWGSAFDTVAQSFKNSIPSYLGGLDEIWQGFSGFYEYIITDFVPEIVNSFSVNLAPLFGDVLGFAIEELGKNFEWLGGLYNDISKDIIIPAYETLKTVITGIFDAIGKAWSKYGEPFLDKLSQFVESIRTYVNLLYEHVVLPVWNKLKQVIDKVWAEHLKPLVDEVAEGVLIVGSFLLDLYNNVVAPVVNWIIKNILPIVVNVVNKIIELAGKLLGSVADTIRGVITTIKGIIQFITGVFTGDWKKAWEGVKNVASGVWNAIKGVFTTAWNAIKLVWVPVGTFFTSVWNTIKKVFSSVATFFGNTFGKAWERVKGVFSKGGKIFSGIKDGIASTFKTIVNKLISGINTIVKTPFNAINKMLNTIRGVEVLGVSPFKSLWKKNPLPIPQIPKLATGGIVDKATLALIGERGKEAVVPLENNTEWMDKLAAKLTSNTPSKIVLMLDGKELGYATIGSINNITRQTGTLPLVIA